MREPPETPFFKRIQDLFQSFGLTIDPGDVQSGFDIHDLAKIFTELPFESSAFKVSFFSFVFVKDGVGVYTTDEKRFELQPNTVYFTNPGHFKSFAWSRAKHVYLISMTEGFLKQNVHPDIFEEFPFLLSETINPRVLDDKIYAEFDQLCKQILAEYTKDSAYRDQIIGNLFVVMLLKIKTYFWEDYTPVHQGDRSSQIVKNFLICLEQHFTHLGQTPAPKPLRVQDCADDQNLHPNYLSSVIKSRTGKSANAWIIEKTIAQAKALLCNSSVSVQEISYQLGFTESTHFSNYFKKHTGQSPMQFRAQ